MADVSTDGTTVAPRRALVEPRRRVRADAVAFGLVIAALLIGVAVVAGIVVQRVSLSTTHALAAAPGVLEAYESSCAPSGAASAEPSAAPTKVDDGPAGGTVIGEILIESLDLRWPIVAGVTPEALAVGVGWYPGTALPGEVGNMAIAGHRIMNGEPFRRIAELPKGAEVRIVTCYVTYVYEIDIPTSELTVDVDDAWVLDPLPGHPGQRPTTSLLTLTANQDLLPTRDRSVAVAHLVQTLRAE